MADDAKPDYGVEECGERWDHSESDQWPHVCIRPKAFHDLYDHKCCCGATKERRD